MKIEFRGVVDSIDEADYRWIDSNEAITIGGEDIVDEIHEYRWGKDVAAILDGTVVDRGRCVSDIAACISEYTWLSSDELKIGKSNLLDILRGMVGQSVHLLITDEPESTNP